MDKLTLGQLRDLAQIGEESLSRIGDWPSILREEAARREAEAKPLTEGSARFGNGPGYWISEPTGPMELGQTAEPAASNPNGEREGLGSAAAFTLEVGKEYARRDGTGPEEITSYNPEYLYPFFGKDGETYLADGSVGRSKNDPADLVALWQAEAQAPQTDAGDTPKTCDGKEQEAFEAWAKSQHMNMEEHPLHYLFLDQRTGGARDGWRAALAYCRPFFEAQAREIAEKDATLVHYIKGDNRAKDELTAERDALKARVSELEKEAATWCKAATTAFAQGQEAQISHTRRAEARVARLEDALRKAAVDLREQVRVSNKYAEDSKHRELRGIPGTWEIQNSHFVTVAQELEAALAGDKTNG